MRWIVLAVVIAAATPAMADDAPADITSGLDMTPLGMGKAIFGGRCANCHAIEPGKQGLGPSLFGVLGRKAGSEAGFEYTPRFKGADFAWTPETIRSFLANSTTATPIAYLRHTPVADIIEQQAVVTYLETLK